MARGKHTQSQSSQDNECSLNIPNFNSNSKMNIKSYLQYFNLQAKLKQLDDNWKVNHIATKLEGEAFSFYLDNLIEESNWATIEEKLIRQFFYFYEDHFETFMKLTFDGYSDIQTYFRKKTAAAHKVGISTENLISALNQGVPEELRKLLLVSNVDTPEAWITLAAKLVKNISIEKKESNKTEVKTLSREENMQKSSETFLKAQRKPIERYYKQPHQRSVQHTPGLFQLPIQKPLQYGSPRMGVLQQSRSVAHHAGKLPSRPCRLCSQQGIFNAYHWEQTCPWNQDNNFNAQESVADSLSTVYTCATPLATTSPVNLDSSGPSFHPQQSSR